MTRVRMLLVKNLQNNTVELVRIEKRENLDKHIYKCLYNVPKRSSIKVYELKTLYGTIYTKVKPEYKDENTFIFPFGTKFYTSKYCITLYETNVLLYKTYQTLVKEIELKPRKSKKFIKKLQSRY